MCAVTDLRGETQVLGLHDFVPHRCPWPPKTTEIVTKNRNNKTRESSLFILSLTCLEIQARDTGQKYSLGQCRGLEQEN